MRRHARFCHCGRRYICVHHDRDHLDIQCDACLAKAIGNGWGRFFARLERLKRPRP